jgi:hypothetical protein
MGCGVAAREKFSIAAIARFAEQNRAHHRSPPTIADEKFDQPRDPRRAGGE